MSNPPNRLRAGLITKEYPPTVYGGAGVHVTELARALTDFVDVAVHAFGPDRNDPLVAGSYGEWDVLAGPASHLAALRTFSTDLAVVAGLATNLPPNGGEPGAASTAAVDLVHSHTWYANLAGHLARLTYDVPHVATTHSLEPLRPWKREQLAGGYALSSFAERTALEHADAIIAVSSGMADDVLRCYPAVDPGRVEIIHNGIDPSQWHAVESDDELERQGIDPDRPYVVFVGRITRQKGVVHLVDAIRHLDPDAQVVLCAGAPDTPEIAAEFRSAVDQLRSEGRSPVWIEEMLPRERLLQVLTHARVFACPSIYEPFGIVNLEAMACGLPVVASAVGGIPEVVVPGETGALVAFTPGDDEYGSPADPEAYARDLAAALTVYLDDADLARRHGLAGRARVEERFAWTAVARQTAALYARLV